MKKLIFGFIALLFSAHSALAQTICDPADTRVVISGVLQWQDPSVNSFSDENRKDLELHNLFSAAGIPDSANALLLDEEATLEKMNRNIKRQMKACGPESTFIFYYAGHGSKIGNAHYFCNFDMRQAETSMFDVNTISTYAKLYFKGKRIILMADCCYSGSLLKVGEEISKSGVEVVVLTSATSSNISTGNWTFTQTLLDDLRGDVLADTDKNNLVSLAETAFEIKQAMKYREYQLSGFATYNVDAAKLIVGKCPQDSQKKTVNKSVYACGNYVYALDENRSWKPARIVKSSDLVYTCQFYNYSVKVDVDASANSMRSVYFPVYEKGKKVDVKWEGKYYPAEILNVDDAFMYIHYTGDDESYDEWIMYDRIITGNEEKKSILWEGSWYPGYVLEKNDTACFISYEGYAHTWDEWVSLDRVK